MTTDLKFLEQAEIAEMDTTERESYQESLKVYRDLTNVISTAEEKGRLEGREDRDQELREKWKDKGLSDDEIDDLLGE